MKIHYFNYAKTAGRVTRPGRRSEKDNMDTLPKNSNHRHANGDWFPVPNRLIQCITVLSATEFAVLMIYLYHQNLRHKIAYPGAGTIAKLIGHADVRHVRRAIRRLEQQGYITTLEAGGGGSSARRKVTIPRSSPVAESAMGTRGGIGHPKKNNTERGDTLLQFARARRGAMYRDDPEENASFSEKPVTFHRGDVARDAEAFLDDQPYRCPASAPKVSQVCSGKRERHSSTAPYGAQL